ncbi:Iron-dependent extradiol dioxygenase [BD1-7 clade bacterium]|nr:Iron-dependent extradiol dioxygenase [BD1-7 clade bacterium]
MRIKALGYIIIEATNPAAWQGFMEDTVGMMLAPSMDNSNNLYFKMDEYSWRFRVEQSDKDCLSYAGWELVDKTAFDQALAELDTAGTSYERLSAEACEEKGIREGIGLKDPGGNYLELFYQMKLDYQRLISKVGVPNFLTGYHGDMGLGHWVLPTSSFDECYAFYKDVLGFGDVDYMHFHFNPDPQDPGQGLHFMHVDNPRHHSLAIYQDPNPPESNCVHLMVEVDDMDEVGYFIDRCKQNDVPIVSTLGRHTNDLMISVYVATPGGFALEFGCDGVQVDWEDYKPTTSSVPSLWGHEWNHG